MAKSIKKRASSYQNQYKYKTSDNNTRGGLKLPLIGVKLNSGELRKILVIGLCVFGAGVIIGLLLVMGLSYPSLEEYLFRLAHELTSRGADVYFLLGRFWQYAMLTILMWALFFMPQFSFLVFFVVLYRGILIGFNTFFLIGVSGMAGIGQSILLYFPQNIVVLAIYFFVIRSGIKYIEKKSKIEYCLELMLVLFIISLISLYETYLLPSLIIHLLSV